MEIQQETPRDLPLFLLQSPFSYFPIPNRPKITRNLRNISKYASRLHVLEPSKTLPRDKKRNPILLPVKQLSRKKITEVEINLDFLDDLHVYSLIAKYVKRLRNIHKLTLTLNSYRRLNLDAIKRMMSAFADLKNLKNGYVQVPYYTRYIDKRFLELWKPFTKNRLLRNLDASVLVCYGIKGNILKEMHQAMNSLKLVKNINLNFVLSENNYRSRLMGVNTTFLQRLSRESTEKIALTLDIPFLIERKELLRVLSCVSLFDNLKSLVLNFTSFAERVDGEIISYLINALSHMKSLVYLDLSFELCWFLDEIYILYLTRAINKLKNLRALKLDFGACFEITNQSLLQMAKTLKFLPKLELISLDYHSCYQINDLGVSCLLSIMTTMKVLTQVELGFANCYKLTSEVIKHLENFGSLTALSLNFEGCALMNQNTILRLSGIVSKFRALQYLSLNLNYLQSVTNYEICVLGTCLANLKELKYIGLDFMGYKNLTDLAFTNFFRKIGNLKNLKSLHLNFRYVSQISDKAISVFATIVCGMSELKELSLDLLGAKTISESCYPKLVKIYSKFEDSKRVGILI